MLPTCRPDVGDSAQGFLSYLPLYFFPSSLHYVTQPSLHVTSEVDHMVIPTAVPVNKIPYQNYVLFRMLPTSWGSECTVWELQNLKV